MMKGKDKFFEIILAEFSLKNIQKIPKKLSIYLI